jgi:S-formylglutathione hydrolase FrmB
MRSVSRPAQAGSTAPTGIICLPGAYHAAEDFLAAGFDRHVRARGLDLDLTFVDPELAHLADRGFQDHLRHAHVLPARAAGCKSLWVTGISLGGFLALDYAATHPGELDGLCLIAPYLGNRMLIGEIARAPGLAAWSSGTLAESDEERRIWRFVQRRPPGSPRVHLGFGQADRFAQAHRLLAATLPPGAVDVVPGGHDWPTWTVLWESFLESTFR